jgi:hypothetical protein
MKARRLKEWKLAVACTLALSNGVLAQQDEGPILKPNKAPTKPSAGATLLVMCDLACRVPHISILRCGIRCGASPALFTRSLSLEAGHITIGIAIVPSHNQEPGPKDRTLLP